MRGTRVLCRIGVLISRFFIWKCRIFVLESNEYRSVKCLFVIYFIFIVEEPKDDSEKHAMLEEVIQRIIQSEINSFFIPNQ